MFGWSSCHGAFWCFWLFGLCAGSIGTEIQIEDVAPQFLQMDLVLAKPTAVHSPEVPRQMFLWHADAHVDPFYQTDKRQCVDSNLTILAEHPFGIMACDPPPQLLHSALNASAQVGSNVTFALYTGDFVRHSIQRMPDPKQNASEIVQQVPLASKKILQKPLVFGTLGNSDAIEDYYQEITSNESANSWFEQLGNAISSAGGMKAEVLEQFKYGSYFETIEGNLSILSLATVIYSVDHLPFGPLEEDPFGQFQWLRRKLQQASVQKRRAWIVGHIAPGIETFAYTELWHPNYVAEYLQIVQDEELGGVISAQLFGHVHKDEIRILPQAPKGAGPIFLSSSLSPVYYNNPSFKLVEYDPQTGHLLNLKTFISDTLASQPGSNGSVPAWKFGYDHVNEYGFRLGGLDMAEMVNFTYSLLEGGDNYERYASWYATGYPNELEHYSVKAANWNETWKKQRRNEYVCAMVIQTAADFAKCANLRLWQLPQLMDGFDRLILGRLLAWANRSSSTTASEILWFAKEGRWAELLALFRGLVKWSLQQGTPLESTLLTQ